MKGSTIQRNVSPSEGAARRRRPAFGPLELRFDRFARMFGHLAGRPLAFITALSVVVVWLLSGRLFGYSDTWQLVINTATTIVTFLMVFLVQHTQNRDTEALQVKLDELIRAMRRADNTLLDLEELDEAELADLHQRYTSLAQSAREESHRRQGRKARSGADPGTPSTRQR